MAPGRAQALPHLAMQVLLDLLVTVDSYRDRLAALIQLATGTLLQEF
jgi:hypothetical protein